MIMLNSPEKNLEKCAFNVTENMMNSNHKINNIFFFFVIATSIEEYTVNGH